MRWGCAERSDGFGESEELQERTIARASPYAPRFSFADWAHRAGTGGMTTSNLW